MCVYIGRRGRRGHIKNVFVCEFEYVSIVNLYIFRRHFSTMSKRIYISEYLPKQHQADMILCLSGSSHICVWKEDIVPPNMLYVIS